MHMSGDQLTMLGVFGEGLDPNNRWMKLSRIIPWDQIEEIYAEQFDRSAGGHRPLSGRVAFGSLIIQQRLSLTDEETVALIQENPYLQAFLGFGSFSSSRPFDPSLLVHFRKRFELKQLQDINEMIVQAQTKTSAEEADSDSEDPPDDEESGSSHSDDALSEQNDQGTETPSTKGTLMMDATCVPADIAYPTDLNLLNHARELLEQIIDCLHEPCIGQRPKPRTYRQKARQAYLRVAKSKKITRKKAQSACRKQLRFLQRNMTYIQKNIQLGVWDLRLLNTDLYRKLLIIAEVIRQQRSLHVDDERTVKDRIVSIEQPHIRTMVRGKAGKQYEFGAKIAVAHDDGYAFLEGLSWDAYHEASDLKHHAEAYRKRHGFYPERILADKIYRTKENRSWCKENSIRLAGIGPGRPPADMVKRRQQQKDAKQDEADRQPMEGIFGRCKRRFGLSRLLTRLPKTSATVIALVMIVLNLETIVLRSFLGYIIAFLMPIRRSLASSIQRVIGPFHLIRIT